VISKIILIWTPLTAYYKGNLLILKKSPPLGIEPRTLNEILEKKVNVLPLNYNGPTLRAILYKTDNFGKKI
jgi:hypothetical protein